MSRIEAVEYHRGAVGTGNIRAKLAGFATLPVGWRLGEGVPASSQVLKRASRILDIGENFNYAADVFPGSDGSVAVVFYVGELSAEFIIDTALTINLTIEEGTGYTFKEIEYKPNINPIEVVKVLATLTKFIQLSSHSLCNSFESSIHENTMPGQRGIAVCVSGTQEMEAVSPSYMPNVSKGWNHRTFATTSGAFTRKSVAIQ